jgi:DNA invertase Pin-like site-specific DNA recombinase
MKSRSRSRGTRGSRPPSRSFPSALGYTGVPTNGSSGPHSPGSEIERACRSLGLRLIDLVPENEAANDEPRRRPGLERVLARLEGGEVSCLVVSTLELLSRRVDEFASVIDRLERAGARLVVLDVGLDTASSTGRLALERRPVTRAGQSVDANGAGDHAAEEPPATAHVMAPATHALGYATPTAAEQGELDEFEDQAQAIRQRCEELGLDLVDVILEGKVEGRALERPGLSALVERVATGEAGCVVVGSLGRLSHSVRELGAIVNWLEQNEVRLITVELNLDTASSGGRLTTRALASVARWEHDRLSERTRKGLAAARANRLAVSGELPPGDPSASWPDLSKRIAAMRSSGMTLQAIADALNAEGVPTPRGGAEWRPSSVQTAAGYKRRSRAKRTDGLPAVRQPPDGSSPENPS